MTNWHPDHLTRGRIYAFHRGEGQTCEITRLIYDSLEILDGALCICGIDQLTKEQTAIPVKTIFEVQPLSSFHS